MRRILARYLVTLGLTLIALGKRLANDNPPGPGARRSAPGPQAKQIDLPRTQYRVLNRQPGRWEVIRIGLVIIFNSVAYATVGA